MAKGSQSSYHSSIETLFDMVALDLVNLLTSKKLTIGERIKIFEVLVRNYYPIAAQRQMETHLDTNPLFLKITGMLDEPTKTI